MSTPDVKKIFLDTRHVGWQDGRRLEPIASKRGTMIIIILARCEECKHHTEIFHLDWYQLMCPNCNAEIENNYKEEEDVIND